MLYHSNVGMKSKESQKCDFSDSLSPAVSGRYNPIQWASYTCVHHQSLRQPSLPLTFSPRTPIPFVSVLIWDSSWQISASFAVNLSPYWIAVDSVVHWLEGTTNLGFSPVAFPCSSLCHLSLWRSPCSPGTSPSVAYCVSCGIHKFSLETAWPSPTPVVFVSSWWALWVFPSTPLLWLQPSLTFPVIPLQVHVPVPHGLCNWWKQTHWRKMKMFCAVSMLLYRCCELFQRSSRLPRSSRYTIYVFSTSGC